MPGRLPIQAGLEPLDHRGQLYRLTVRELQVVALICEGLSNKQMASRLDIAVHTVKCHVHNALLKLGVSSRLEVAVMLLAPPLPMHAELQEQVA